MLLKSSGQIHKIFLKIHSFRTAILFSNYKNNYEFCIPKNTWNKHFASEHSFLGGMQKH